MKNYISLQDANITVYIEPLKNNTRYEIYFSAKHTNKLLIQYVLGGLKTKQHIDFIVSTTMSFLPIKDHIDSLIEIDVSYLSKLKNLVRYATNQLIGDFVTFASKQNQQTEQPIDCFTMITTYMEQHYQESETRARLTYARNYPCFDKYF